MNLNKTVPKVSIPLVLTLGLLIQISYFYIAAIVRWGAGTYQCPTTGPIPNYCGLADYLLSTLLLQNLIFLYPTIISLSVAYLSIALWKTFKK